MSLLLDIYGLLSVVLNGLLLTAEALTLGGIAFLTLLALPLAQELGEAGGRSVDRCRLLLRCSAGAVALVVTASVASEVAVLIESLDLSLAEALTAPFAVAGLMQLAAAIAVILLSRRHDRGRLLAVAGLLLLGAGTATSHAIAHPNDRALLALATALHRLSTASWIGGIPYLLIALASCRGGVAWRRVGKRFSQIAMLSVAVILATGLAMSIDYVGSLAALYGTAYGIMLMAKVLLFFGLLLLGGMNFLTVERLRHDPAAPALRLRRFAEVETGIGITVLFIAASITSLPPAADLTTDRVTLAEYAVRFTPRWPSFISPEQSSLAIAVLQAQLDAKAQQDSMAPTAYVPGAGLPPPRNAANIAWSEYNHHWAGALVLVIALLTLAERTGKAGWAANWPLLFVLLGLFLGYRDGVESGLEDNIGFLALLRDPEYVQHLFFYLLIAAFGVFEWSVRTGRLRSRMAALVFPLLTATAGGALLTHAHAIANVKDLLLIEVTHVPLALLGVVVGWARWLELRLEPAEGRIAGWIWPPCFLLVGILLLAYREI